MAKQDYVNFILDVFANSDPCATEVIDADSVDFWLDIALDEFNNYELVFLRAYQSACYALMSCYSSQYDITERRGESHSLTEGKSDTDGYRQVQATGSSNTSDIQAQTARYNDYSRASMDASATRNGCSHSDSYGIATMDDSGEGSKRTRARKRSIAKAHHDAQQHQGSDTVSTDIGKSEACDFSHSYDAVSEDHAYSFIVSATEIGKHGHSTREMTNTQGSNGETVGTQQDWSIANTRKISVDGVRRDSCGQFNSSIISTSKDQAKSDSSNDYHAQRTQRQKAEGQGYQRGSQDAISTSSHVLNDLTHKSTDAKKTTNSWRFSTISSYKNSQKYDSLKKLYDILKSQIEERQRNIGRTCSPFSSTPSQQPFLASANCGDVNLTIQKLLWKFPCLMCFY